MKTRWKYLIAGLTMFVLCISVFTTTTDATLVWQDDFSDPNLPGWTFHGYTNTTEPVKTEGNFSAADGTLKVLDDDINVARHDSTVTIGTWTFDMFVPVDYDAAGAFYVQFMSNGSSLPVFGNQSWIAIGPWIPSGMFYVWTGYGDGFNVDAEIEVDSIFGWHHIVVSSDDDGLISVYLNGTFEADFDNWAITSSTYLQVYCNNVTGAAIDNLVVEIPTPTTTTPTPTPTTPTSPTTPTLDPIMIGLIGGIGIGVVILLAIVYLRRK